MKTIKHIFNFDFDFLHFNASLKFLKLSKSFDKLQIEQRDIHDY